MSLETEVKDSRKRWPNQPLILLEIDGYGRAVPIGHVFSFTAPIDRVRIIGIMNADGTLVVQA